VCGRRPTRIRKASNTERNNPLEANPPNDPETAQIARERNPRSRASWLAISGLATCLVVGTVLLATRSDLEEPKSKTQTTTSSVTNSTPDGSGDTRSSGSLAVEDDSALPWVSPTAGPPISLSYLPLGTQLLLHIRPASLVAHSEGKKVLAALGPWGAWAGEQINRTASVRWEEIEQLGVAVHPQADGRLSCTLRIQLVQPWTDAQLIQRLANSRAATLGKQSYRVVEDRAYFLPVGGKGGTLIVGPAEEVVELIENGGAPPPFSRDLQRLLRQTDANRTATLLFSSKFLQASGSELLSGPGKELLEVFFGIVGNDATAVALSAHWDKNFFLELRSIPTLDNQPHQFAKRLGQSVARSPDAMDKALLDDPLPPYGRQVVARFPDMLRQLSNYTRTGEEEGVAVVRCYLPVTAGHNLLMASELMLNRPGRPANVVEPSTPTRTIAQALQQITTLSFSKETLQEALEMLAEDLGIAIELRGSDLQLEGITKNQSFGLDQRDRPAEEILLEVLRLANPDRTAAGPQDSKQKLVYWVREAVETKPGAIVVTTRSAASRRGERLPAVFGPDSR